MTTNIDGVSGECEDQIYNQKGKESLPPATTLSSDFQKERDEDDKPSEVVLKWATSALFQFPGTDIQSKPENLTEIIQIRQSTNEGKCFRNVKSHWEDLHTMDEAGKADNKYQSKEFSFDEIETKIINATGFSHTCYVQNEVDFEFRIKSVKEIDGMNRTAFSKTSSLIQLRKAEFNDDISIAIGTIAGAFALFGFIIFVFWKNRARRLSDNAIKVIDKWRELDSKPPLFFVDFERVKLERELGKGAFGEVYEANILPKKRFSAIQKVNISFLFNSHHQNVFSSLTA